MSQDFRHRSQEQRYSTFAELIEDAAANGSARSRNKH